MDKRLVFILLLASSSFNQSIAQTYIGEILYRDSYEYIKIQCEDDECKFSIPYIDNNQKYKTDGNPSQNNQWTIQKGVEKWQLNTQLKNDVVVGELDLPTGKQQFLLRLQKEAVPKDAQEAYIGVYEDGAQRKAIVYTANNYLLFMSPYSEQTMSLKPIGENYFWSMSGENSTFSNLKNEHFQNLQVVDRFGNQKTLTRCAITKVEELWIPIGPDTLYGRMYIPSSTTKVPACLILPGGGATGVDNYEYEARYLAAYGIASLVFDKPGNGQSKGSTNFRFQSFEEKNDQYKKIFAYLKNHPKIDSQKTGIHGSSEGGRLALLMAIDLKEEVAFVNAVATPLMTFREGQFYAMDQLHRNMGIDEFDNMDIQKIWNDYYDGIEKGEIDSDIIERANVYRSQNQRLFLPPDLMQLPASPHKDDISNDRVVRDAREITCPIFLQYGENDQRVSRSKSLQNFLPRFSKPKLIHTKIYPRGTHSMMTPEYKICPGYTDDKINWLKSIGIPINGCN